MIGVEVDRVALIARVIGVLPEIEVEDGRLVMLDLRAEPLFQWGRGAFVVPLDAYPSWYLGRPSPSTIRLTVSTLDCSGGWTVVSKLTPRRAGYSRRTSASPSRATT